MTLPMLPAEAALADVGAWLDGVGAALPPTDGFAYFNVLYAEVTRRVIARVAAGDVEDPRFVGALDVRFAALYQAALVAPVVPRAWRRMRERRADAAISPAAFAFAGMNAHINRDLTVALVTTSEALGVPLDRGSAAYRDFTAIDQVLAELMDEAKALLFSRFGQAVDAAFGRFDDLLEVWSIRAARQHAWANAEVALALPPGPARDGHVAVVDRTAAIIGRLLLW